MKQKNFKTLKKPPLGLTPRYISEEEYIEERLIEIHQAMQRYTKAKVKIPKEWEEEIRDLQLHKSFVKIFSYKSSLSEQQKLNKLIDILSSDFPYEVHCPRPGCNAKFMIKFDKLIQSQI